MKDLQKAKEIFGTANHWNQSRTKRTTMKDIKKEAERLAKELYEIEEEWVSEQDAYLIIGFVDGYIKASQRLEEVEAQLNEAEDLLKRSRSIYREDSESHNKWEKRQINFLTKLNVMTNNTEILKLNERIRELEGQLKKAQDYIDHLHGANSYPKEQN